MEGPLKNRASRMEAMDRIESIDRAPAGTEFATAFMPSLHFVYQLGNDDRERIGATWSPTFGDAHKGPPLCIDEAKLTMIEVRTFVRQGRATGGVSGSKGDRYQADVGY